MLALVMLSLAGLAAAVNEFLYPGPGPTQIWRLGEVHKIRYRTNLQAYTIAIWQQSLAGGSANLGPIIFQTIDGPYFEFDWLAQLYSWDLRTSNIFFLWLVEGNATGQSDRAGRVHQTSAFFNMTTSDELPKSTSKSSSSSQVSTPAFSSHIASSTDNASHDRNNDPGVSGELSAGAKVGIGAGAGVLCLAALIATGLFLRYRARKKKEMRILEKRNNYSEQGKGVFQQPPLPVEATGHPRPVTCTAAELGS